MELDAIHVFKVGVVEGFHHFSVHGCGGDFKTLSDFFRRLMMNACYNGIFGNVFELQKTPFGNNNGMKVDKRILVFVIHSAPIVLVNVV